MPPAPPRPSFCPHRDWPIWIPSVDSPANSFRRCWGGDMENGVRKLTPLGGLPALWGGFLHRATLAKAQPQLSLLAPSRARWPGLSVLPGQKQGRLCSLNSLSASINRPFIKHSSNNPLGLEQRQKKISLPSEGDAGACNPEWLNVN